MLSPPVKDEISEAMASFSDYQIPELKNFLARCNLPVGGNHNDLVDRIKNGLRAGSIPVERAFDYIDELKETGEQHLFLYRLRRSHKHYLQKLQDWKDLKDRVAAVDDGPLPGEDRQEVRQGLYKPKPREPLFYEHVQASPTPSLSAVYRRIGPRPELFFKWLELRHWTKVIPDGPNVKIVDEYERSANFLCIDLSTGDMQIRLQRLHPKPEITLREEMNLYRKLAGRLVDLDVFEPVLIEPVIHRFLTSSRAKVVRWQVRWVDVGTLSGGIDPGFVRGVLTRFGHFSAISLEADWLYDSGTPEPKKVRANLNGITNQVDIPNRCVADEAATILADILSVPPAKLKIPDLDAVARDHEVWRPFLQHIDWELSVEGQQEVELHKVAERAWFSEAEAIRAGEEIARRFPKTYRIRYFVSCPITENPVSNETGPIYFERRADIPPQLACRHGKGKGVGMHITQDRVRAVLTAQPASNDWQPMRRIAAALEKKVGKTHIGNVIRALSFLLFAILYVPMVWGTAWLFLRLTEMFPGGAMISHLTFSLVLILEAGMVAGILGKPLTDRASDLLLMLASVFEGRRPAGGGLAGTTVHPSARIPKAGKKKRTATTARQ